MRELFRHHFWIVLTAAVVFLTNLGSAALFDMDEALYASCAREMAQRGDWVVPWFNGQMSSDKPPLMFWLMMLTTKLVGPTELAVRFQAALFGIATAVATYHIGRILFSAKVGLWAGLIVSTSIIFTVSARAATVDSALTFAVTAAVLILVAGGFGRQNASHAGREDHGGHSPLDALLPNRWTAMAMIYAAMGVAVLAKGPVGLVMPLGTIGLFLLVMNRPAATAGRTNATIQFARLTVPCGVLRLLRWLRPLVDLARIFSPRNLWQVAWRMRPLTAIAVVGLVAVPWYVLVGLRTDGRWLYEFMGKYNLGPAVKPILGHTGPFFYHFVVVFIGFFPWSVFLVPAIVDLVRRIRDGHRWHAGYVLVSCWAAVVIGLWTVVAMKLPHHILPAYPALALLTATFVAGWIADPAHIARWWIRNAMLTLIIVGAGIMVALPVVAAIFLPGEGVLGLVGLPLIVGGTLCLFYSRRGKPLRTMVAFTATSAVFLTAMFGFAVLRVDRHQIAPPLVAAVRRSCPDRPELASYRFFRESFVYYSGRPVARCHTTDHLAEFLDRARHPYVLTTDEHVKEIRQEFPGEFYVLARRRRFLEPGEAVVLARRPGRNVPHTAAKDPASRRH